ncbi:MAG TPA: cysteine desulfurase [Candidatus Norongarragalinales archaeon]|nr:cysteine desulfurase [Candidatus Norongarragalinales archaeon]
MFDPIKIKPDFPTLRRKVNGKELVYLDSTATAQRPVQVIQAMDDYYNNYNASVHRGIYTISEEATDRYEKAREKIARFINARPQEVIFTRNATESLNLVAYAYGDANVTLSDSILSTQMEHHSNMVPWQELAKRKNAKLNYVMVNEEGFLKMDEFDGHLLKKPKIAAFTHASNVLGTINPVREMVKKAHEAGAVAVVDGAQSVPHMKVDVKELDCDFFAFSGHKMLGPTGIGVLYGKEGILDRMEPFLTGGSMIREVTLEYSKWADLPSKFEAGTPAIAEAIGLGAAVDYLNKLGMADVRTHEIGLTKYALEKLNGFGGMRIYGPKDAAQKEGVISFLQEGVHPHDAASLLDEQGIAVRAGHHCAHPLMMRYNVPATLRASVYVYNSKTDIDKLLEALKVVEAVLKK